MEEKRLSERVSTRFSKDVYNQLQAEAKTAGISVAELLRRIVEKHYQTQNAVFAAPVVEEVLRQVIEPHVDRLAVLAAHAGLNAGTAAWLSKALANLKQRQIPNCLTFSFGLVGIMKSISGFGVPFTLILLVAGIIVCEVLYRFRVFGGGDLKLLLGLVMFAGFKTGFYIFYFSLLAALPLFAFYLLKNRTTKLEVPFAVALLAGFIMTVIYEGW